MSLDKKRIAVIGLGAMGAALARTLATAGAEVHAWNRTFSKAEALQSVGVIACATATEAITGSDCIIVCVSGYPAWRGIAKHEALEAMLSEKTLIQLTTGTIDEVAAHARWAEQSGARLLDGTIKCFPRQIGTEGASIILAGEEAILPPCRDILETLSPNLSWLGEDFARPVILGRALISRTLGAIFGTIHGAAMCKAGGIPLSHYTEHVQLSHPVVTGELTRICQAIESGDTETTEASLQTWAEGHKALLDVATTLTTATELQNAIQTLFQRARDIGLGEHDIAAMVKVFEGDKAPN